MMRDDNVERVLAKDDGIVPSSGFTNRVMEAVRREAATPPPLRFPLWRALPGWVAAAITVALALAGVVREARMSAPATERLAQSMSGVATAWLAIWAGDGGSWILLGLVVSFVAVKLSLRAVSGKP
jgi:hypothetical protein